MNIQVIKRIIKIFNLAVAMVVAQREGFFLILNRGQVLAILIEIEPSKLETVDVWWVSNCA
jgi:hypothetical protein